jgi:hypothetical protein
MPTLRVLCAGAAIFCASHTFCFAQVVFEDDFNAENGGVAALNYSGFANWTVSDGFVDLIGNTFFDIYPGNGLYVDLEGSNQNAGTLTSTLISLTPGTYSLEFDLGINGGFGNDQMTVSLGAAYSEVFDATDAGVADDLSLVFDHLGADDFGLVIDNVSLTRLVPEPSCLALVALGLIGLRVAGRSRRLSAG